MSRFREHRVVDGVPSFRCPRCRKWKPKQQFFTQTPARHSKWCAPCLQRDSEARA